DAGVSDEQIDRSQASANLADGSHRVFAHRYIGDTDSGCASATLDLSCERVELLAPPRYQADLAALGGQGMRQRPTDTAGRSRDDSNLTREHHVYLRNP